MYSVYGLRLDPNFGVRLQTDQNFYLRLTVEKMNAFAAFTEKYLQSYGCSGTNFTIAVNCRNLKLKRKLKLSKHKSFEYKYLFCNKSNISPYSGKLVCLQLIDLIGLVINSWLIQPL